MSLLRKLREIILRVGKYARWKDLHGLIQGVRKVLTKAGTEVQEKEFWFTFLGLELAMFMLGLFYKK